MESLFEQMSIMLTKGSLLAVVASFVWGVFSIVLSPCHLASIPLIVGFINQYESCTTRRAALISSLFTAGILLSLGLIGGITALLGRLLGDIGLPVQLAIVLLLILLGLHLMEVITLPFPEQDGEKFAGMRQGLFTALVLGIVMGTALGPCSFAFLAPLIGIALASPGEWGHTFSLFIAYGFGHGIVIVLAGTFSGVLKKYLNWNEQSRTLVIVKKLCGVLVICAAIYSGMKSLL